MKIVVKENKVLPIVIYVPLPFLGYVLKKSEKEVDQAVLKDLIRELKAFKKTHKNFLLIEVESKDGTHIKITL